MTQSLRVLRVVLAGAAVLAAAAAAYADDDLSFRRRGDEEKRFVGRVAEAVVKAAHKTAKKVDLIKYEYTHPKPNRTDLTMKVGYHGAVTNKQYTADVVVKIDSTNKDAWEVLNIEYTDNNNVPFNEKKVQELIRQLNR
jgi:hypothetical protein